MVLLYLRAELVELTKPIHRSQLDCLFSLSKASAAIGEPLCRPEFVESDEAFVDFTALRHPALCLRDDFIPNDVKMGKSAQGIMLLTGANMAGKSTMMRMTAAGIIMAQLGMYVPAEAARCEIRLPLNCYMSAGLIF